MDMEGSNRGGEIKDRFGTPGKNEEHKSDSYERYMRKDADFNPRKVRNANGDYLGCRDNFFWAITSVNLL